MTFEMDEFDEAAAVTASLLPENYQRRIRGGESLLVEGQNKAGEPTFGRTEVGQAIFDVLFSRMSAAEASRRHGVACDQVIELRRKYRKFREAA